MHRERRCRRAGGTLGRYLAKLLLSFVAKSGLRMPRAPHTRDAPSTHWCILTAQYAPLNMHSAHSPALPPSNRLDMSPKALALHGRRALAQLTHSLGAVAKLHGSLHPLRTLFALTQHPRILIAWYIQLVNTLSAHLPNTSNPSERKRVGCLQVVGPPLPKPSRAFSYS